jgi:hypothetical protein
MTEDIRTTKFLGLQIHATLDYLGRGNWCGSSPPPPHTMYDVLQRIRACLWTEFGLPLFITAAS